MSLTLFADWCETPVELIVELGLMTPTSFSGIWDVAIWDTSFWGTGPDRRDVSDYVRLMNTSRSFSDDLKSWNAGSVNIVLDNRDGRFSPDNLEFGAPYVVAGLTGIRPGCPIWVSIQFAGTTYPLFAGYATDWNEGWQGHSITASTCDDNIDPDGVDREGDAFMALVGTDEWGRLGRQKRRTPVALTGAGDTFGERISRILASAGYSGSTVLGSGVATFQDTDLSSEVLGELNKTAESEGGAVWVDADGSVVAKGRYALMEDVRSSTIQVAFGDNPAAGEIMWTNISIAPVSDQGIINHAIYMRTGGTAQEVSDATSIVLYGTCDDDSQPTDLTCQDDAQVLALAQWRVITGNEPEAVVNDIQLKPRCDLDTLAPMVLDRQIRDLISIRIRPPSTQNHYFYRECFIAGISHTIAEDDWTVTFNLSSATAYRKFATSLWDQGTWGANDVDTTGAKWFV